MRQVFIGREALASGALTRAKLRWNYRRIFRDIYVPATGPPSLRVRTTAAWLWSGRSGVITGRAAAALHGARWVGEAVPIEMIWRCGRPPPAIIVRTSESTATRLPRSQGCS
jgi:hypothetical protein